MNNKKLITVALLLGVVASTHTRQSKKMPKPPQLQQDTFQTKKPVWQVGAAGVVLSTITANKMPVGVFDTTQEFNTRIDFYYMKKDATVNDLKNVLARDTGYNKNVLILKYNDKELRGNQQLKNLPDLTRNSIWMSIATKNH